MMKRTIVRWLVSVLFLAASTIVVRAADTVLKVGDRAPAVQAGNWVQGQPVRRFEKGTAYIVEFWATWCGPCRASIPHLNEIANKYKDKGLVVIGQDCWESDDSRVAPFVKSMGDKMTYRVALDNKDGSARGRMSDTWMTAASQNGIPTAFLVDKNGLIAWIGHPMSLDEKSVEEVLAGTFDMPKAANAYAVWLKTELPLRSAERDVSIAIQRQDWTTATARLAEAEKLLPADRRDELDITRYRILVGERDNAGADKLAAAMRSKRPNDRFLQQRLDIARFGILISIRDYPSANALARLISDARQDDAGTQNYLAWSIASEQPTSPRDLASAEIIATRANNAAQGKDAATLDTLARVLFLEGKRDQAIAVQQKAVEVSGGMDREERQATLDRYRQGQAPKPD